MSAENVQQPDPHKEFVQQFTKEVETALHALAEKYKGQINDVAIVVNWTPENHKKPYPKLIVETLRDVQDGEFDPVRQAMELSDLLAMGSSHIIRQMLFHMVNQNNILQQKLQNISGANTAPKIIVPGQQK